MVTLFVEEGSTIPPYMITDSLFNPNETGIPCPVARVLVRTDEFAEDFNNCLNEPILRSMNISNHLLGYWDVTEQDLIAMIQRFIQVVDEHLALSSNGEAFFRFAVEKGYFSVALYLLALGTPLHSDMLVTFKYLYSDRWRTAPMIRFLVENGANVLAQTSEEDFVLHNILQLRDMDDDADEDEDSGDTDEDDILEAVKLLIKSYGCDPLGANSHGQTPLYNAVLSGYVSVAQYLLTLGAPPSLTFWSHCPVIHGVDGRQHK